MAIIPRFDLKKDFTCDLVSQFSPLDYYAFIYSHNELNKKVLNDCIHSKAVIGSLFIKVNGVDIPLAANELKDYKESVSLVKKKKERNEYKFMRIINSLEQKTITKSLIYEHVEALQLYRGLLPRLLEAAIYLKVDEKYKFESVLSEIMKKEFHFHLLNKNISTLAIDKKIKQLFKVIDFIKSKTNKDNRYESLLYYIYSGSTGQFKKEFGDKFNVRDNLRVIKNRVASFFNITHLPYVWGPIVFDRLSRKDYSQFIAASLLVKKINTCASCLIFFRDLHTISREDKKRVVASFNELEKKKSFYDKEVKLRLLEDASFYKFLKANIKRSRRPLFNLKRSFYKELLDHEINIEYSIYQLALLGDFSRQSLLKIMALHSHEL